ncbi:MAG: 50S ribosomal protein L11 methyltransferase [Acidimicrobiales bacterium]
MSWVVRIHGADSESIEIAATLAESSGWAHDGDTVLVGFIDHGDAVRFAQENRGVVEPARTWDREDLAHIVLPTGEIELEVGAAFGHGGHPTSRLALDALDALGPGEQRTLLDVGTGTGVLSIAAARQGFVATGCDIDPEAVAVATRNAHRNSVEHNTSYVTASPSQLVSTGWLAESEGFDIIVVNTLVGVHEIEGPAIVQLGCPTATLVATGLQGRDQVDRAVGSYPGYGIVDQRDEGPWSLVVLRQ